jgi:hypothetical protein
MAKESPMKSYKHLILCIALLFLCNVSFAQQSKLNWYPFDKDFINNQYSDSAIGELSAKQAHAAKTVHTESCGGNDAELHIGMTLNEVRLPGIQMPLSAPFKASDKGWGIVAELPNANLSDGPAKFAKLNGKAITFTGYFRVWDEGHAVGAVHPSNPHHVFEVHPAWGFRGSGVNYMREDLVAAMDSYRGYGATKFKPLLKAISDGRWPLACQDDGRLYLGLSKDQNFYQLPVEVKAITKVSGGHEVTLDVYSDKDISKLVYSGLTAITVTGSPIDKALKVGQKEFLLGFFSVNLKKALEASDGADSQQEAKVVKDAVEFFVFGYALKSAVTSCSSH